MDTINPNLITLTNADMRNPMLANAFRKLLQGDHPFKTSWTLKRVFEKMIKIQQDATAHFTEEAKKYAELDEKGDFVPATDDDGKPVLGSFKFKDEEHGEKFNEYNKEWMSTIHTFDRDKISVNALGDVNLSAMDISALEPLFSDLD